MLDAFREFLAGPVGWIGVALIIILFSIILLLMVGLFSRTDKAGPEEEPTFDRDPDKLLFNLLETCRRKRYALITKAARRSGRRRLGLSLSGVVTVISGGTLISGLIDPMLWKVILGSLTMLSGLMTVILAHFTDENETQTIFAGSNKFLCLRDKVESILCAPGSGKETDKFQQYCALRTEYGESCAQFDQYLPHWFLKRYRREKQFRILHVLTRQPAPRGRPRGFEKLRMGGSSSASASNLGED